MWKTYKKAVTLLEYGGNVQGGTYQNGVRLSGAAVAVALIDVIQKY